jgi:hypothetical protein
MRSFMTMMALVIVATSAAANDDVQDVRLRVGRLTRPDGTQSATLTGIAAPVATAQPVTVAVQVGATTVTLSGKLSRRGRLRAVGRRLALATPLASFTVIDVDVAGGLATALTLAAEDCVASLRGRRLDCVESTVPSPTPTSTPTPTPTSTTPGDLVDGAYDLTIDNHTPPGTTQSASVTTAADGTRALRLWVSALDFATLTMASDGALTGYYVFGGDAFSMITGSATDQSTTTLSRLTGAYSSSLVTHAFTMERVAEGTSNAFGGTWNVNLGGGGLAGVIDLAVPANGAATAAATTFGSPPIYTTRAGTCTIAPAGGIYCMLPLTFPPGNEAVYLQGMLDADGGSGQGTFAVGAAPVIRNQGTWTATR